MKIGISTYAYPWSIGIPPYLPENRMDGYQFIKTAAEQDINLVQIADNLPLHKLSEIEREDLYKYAVDLGVEVEVGTRGLQQKNVLRYIRIAQQFNSSILRIVIDEKDFRPEVEEIKEILSDILPELEKSNIILAIENHDRFKAEELVDIVEFFQSSYIGICLDTVNSFGALEEPEKVIRVLGPYTVNLHVKDFKVTRHNSQLGFSIVGTPAGQGMLNITWVINQLQRYGCNFNAVLELWPPKEDNIEDTLIKERQWVVDSMDFLMSRK